MVVLQWRIFTLVTDLGLVQQRVPRHRDVGFLPRIFFCLGYWLGVAYMHKPVQVACILKFGVTPGIDCEFNASIVDATYMLPTHVLFG